MEQEGLQVTSLRTLARRKLQHWTLIGRLRPGKLYTVRAVAETLGVSATPIREAIIDMAGQGILRLARNKGFYVVALSESELDELLQIRILLEVPAMVRLSGTLSEQAVTQYQVMIDRMISEATEEGNGEAYFETSRDFHKSLLNELGMPKLTEMVLGLRDKARIAAIALPANRIDSANEHKELFASIAEGDRERTRKLCIQHLLHHRGNWVSKAENENLYTKFFNTDGGKFEAI